ncbi:MAG: hypothetical protein ACR2PY_00035 [Salinispira sp.]
MKNVPEHLAKFIDEAHWIFAKTYAATWPHEYIVRQRVNDALFVEFVRHTRDYGYVGNFYRQAIPYYDVGDMVYWTMGAAIENTTIINRCRKDQTYEYRLAHNNLPN